MGLSNSSTFSVVVTSLVGLIDSIIPVLAAAAVAIFFFGVVRFVYRSGDAGSKASDKEMIIWGLLALFVLFSVWGILRILSNTFLNTGLEYRPGVPAEMGGGPGGGWYGPY